MKKFKFLILPLTAAAVLLSACGGEPVNQGPELRGVSDVTCLVNTKVDLLDGVAALDTEDGDITPRLQITVTPETAVENGYAVFSRTGDYEICYEVRDSGGKLARTTALASVIDREVYKSDMFTNGFSVSVGGRTQLEAEGLNGNAYAFKTTGNEIYEDVKLLRSFTVTRGVEYTYRYYLNSNRAGKIKAAADGKPVAELNVNSGENVLEFAYTLPSNGPSETKVTDNVNIELWLGGVEGDLECSLTKAEVNYYQEDDGLTEQLPDFSFNGKLINRDDKAHAVYASDDGKSATVEITEPTGQIWQVGMFINVGLNLVAGETYYLSFDIYSELGNDYQICIQHDQWNDGDAQIISTPANGKVEKTINATDTWQGPLWLFIRSGVNQNKITISNLSVKVKSGGQKTESYAIHGFTSNNSADKIKTEYGKVIYTVKDFGNDWGNNEIGSPSFNLSGAADNFVITFTAKASVQLNCVFAATVAANWDTFAWENFKITEEEKVYSINCNKKNLDNIYKFVWQFGNSANAGYHDVTVEISRIKICLKNQLEIKD